MSTSLRMVKGMAPRIPDPLTDVLTAQAVVLERIASILVRRARQRVSLDDARQLVRLATLRALEDGRHPGSPTWPSAVYVRAHSLLRDELESGAATGFGGYTGSMRRQRGMSRTRAQLTARLGREPTDNELVAAHNTARSASRTDAARQGALASTDDLAPHTIAPCDPARLDRKRVAAEYAAYVDDQPELYPHEAAAVIARCLSECRDISDDVWRVAAEWISWYPDGEPVGVGELSRRLGLPATTCSRRLDTARTVFVERFGLELELTA